MRQKKSSESENRSCATENSAGAALDVMGACCLVRGVKIVRRFSSPGCFRARAFSERTPLLGLYCASHKNWIRNIRFSIMNRPLSQ